MKKRFVRVAFIISVLAFAPLWGMYHIRVSGKIPHNCFFPNPKTDLGVFKTAESRITLDMRDIISRQNQLNSLIKCEFNKLHQNKMCGPENDIVALACKKGIKRYKETIIPAWTRKYSKQYQDPLDEKEYIRALEQELIITVEEHEKGRNPRKIPAFEHAIENYSVKTA